MRLASMKRLLVKIKYLIIAGAIVSIYFIVSYTLFKNVINKNEGDIKNIPRMALKLPNVIVHFDMKGSPPKLSYLKTLLPKLRELGVTGLLMEYEDMFPYDGRLVNISAKNCYDKSELKEFLTMVTQMGFDIIPLVQTFGHMEHVLKLEQYENLREVRNRPDSICPSRAESQNLINEMIGQIIKFHKEIFPMKYIHIGCDEVYNMNKCYQCLKRDLPDTDIYLNQVKVVTNIVKTFSSDTTVLIWDDMLRDIPIGDWERANLKIEPVYWSYGPNIKVSHINMMKYHKKFKNIWIASAFKGADGRASTYPNLRKRFSNNFSWLTTIFNYKFGGENNIFNFEGIILTGWSRYSHFDPPCELLPVSIPSLYLNLLLVQKLKQGVGDVENNDLTYFYTKYLQNNLSAHLHCDELLIIDYVNMNQCHFDGNELYEVLLNWDQQNTNILNTIDNSSNYLYAVDFYSSTHNINMNNIEKNIDWVNSSLNEVDYFKKKIMNIMIQYFDHFFIEEYIDFKMYKINKILNDLFKDLNNMSKVRYWKQRPYK
ncbi:unnamed protein product [Euphydryas editha]|uniref:beta-N-acetylhexosaminidase n=1 Tax=Euphydryas editha TaxID=104508 RepID=A0AAU9UGR5_EUPED|nr:unnamed protein product [Euphydryas editha]